MILDLIRHASTGRAGHLDGRHDPPLLAQAADALATRYRGEPCWTRVIASPRRRALDTAQALAAPHGLPVRVDPDWAELDFGQWDGRHAHDIDPAALAAFHRDPVAHPPPGGETWPHFRTRVGTALATLANTRNPGPVLVVSHAGALRLTLSLVCGFPLASLWAIRIDYGTRLRLRVETGADGGLWGELLGIAQP
jgi:alpha-ribazole phosphatase